MPPMDVMTEPAVADAKMDAEVRHAAEAARTYPAVSDSGGVDHGFASDMTISGAVAEAEEEIAKSKGLVAGTADHDVPIASYHPVSPFRLVFEFDRYGHYTSCQVKDPVFVWQYSDPSTGRYRTQTVWATTSGAMSVDGYIYLNLTISASGANAGRVSSATVSDEASGDASIMLYTLSPTKGVVLDARHALLTLGGGGGGGGGLPSCFDIEETVDSSGQVTGARLVRPYFEVSGVLYKVSGDLDISSSTNCFIVVSMSTVNSGNATIETISGDLPDLQSEMRDQSKVTIPLYKIGSTAGSVDIDFRHAPRADMWSWRDALQS